MITLYNKDGTVKFDIKEYEYVGNFMGERKITFKVYAEIPITFNIGDYAIFRSETYKIYEIPQCIKRAEKQTYGSAFEYDVTLNHIIQDLAECSFLDYVINDNQIHYSNFSNPSFYCSANDLADRIQVNLERLYTGWNISVDPSYESEVLNIQANNISCLGALGLFSSLFKTTFTINEKTIVVGAQMQQVPWTFLYKDGLETIEKSKDSSSRIITRLRAYGSKDNLPLNYNNGKGVYPESFFAPGLMLPHSSDSGIDYIDSPNISIYGIREASIYFDGNNELEKIYPTISGMTAEQLIAAGVPTTSTGALDEVVSASQVTEEEQASVIVTIKDIGFDINDYLASGAAIVMKSGECIGSELSITGVEKIENGYVLTVSRKNEGSFYIPNLNQNIKAGDKFVLIGIQMPEVYVLAAEQRLLSAAQNWLSKNDKEIKRYVPHIDNYKIFNNNIVLKEGLSIEIADTDLNLNDDPVIQTLTIKFGGDIPIHEVTLSETIRESFNEKIQRLAREAYKSESRSYLSSSFLSKINDDAASGLITFLRGLNSKQIATLEKGWKTKEFVPGLVGTGSYFDAFGNGELRSLRLWESLEVPELRYNRAEVFTGINWQTFGAGIIESVEIDKDAYGNELQSGVIHLKLEEGEIGKVAVDDMCMGIYHNFGGPNDTVQEDQRNGNFRMKGFLTSYFRIDEILETGTNASFHYVLRGTSERWNQLNHPKPYMHFACYSNPTNPDRQACMYTTTEYSIRLRNMTTWEYGESNIYAIEGKLDGFQLGETVFTGTGQVIGNGYFYGHIQSIENAPYELKIENGGDNFLAFGESMEIICKVFKGLNDVTSEVEDWSVSRESGNQTEDDAWNIAHQNFNGQITLQHNVTYTDLGAGLSTLFRFTATGGNDTAILELTI